MNVFKRLFIALSGPVIMRLALPRRLTVLCYHRVGDPAVLGRDGDPGVVSATPEAFARHMRHFASRFTPISMDDLLKAVETETPLPRDALLVTFDDGYRDALDVAWPIMKEAGVPMTLFLATGHVGTARPFFWDYAHACLRATSHTRVHLPGEKKPRALPDVAARHRAAKAWTVWAKGLTLDDRDTAMLDLAEDLDVSLPPALFRDRMLGWDDLRAVQDQIHLGCHGARHPVYAQLTNAQAAADIRDSFATFTRELGRPPITFAYPNGGIADQGPREAGMLHRSGVRLAFTLSPGPCSFYRVRAQPYGIRRVTIAAEDDPRALVAKIHGSSRLATLFKGAIYRPPPPPTPLPDRDRSGRPPMPEAWSAQTPATPQTPRTPETPASAPALTPDPPPETGAPEAPPHADATEHPPAPDASPRASSASGS